MGLRLALFFLLLGLLFVYMSSMPGKSYKGPLPPLSSQEKLLEQSLRTHVEHLAGAIGERNLGRYQKLEQSVEYITQVFESLGFEIRLQPYEVFGLVAKNIEATRRGQGDNPEIVLIGAHYDTVPESPGANDNASGVAALLEMARAFQKEPLKRTLKLVAFVNEEPPFFLTKDMGSTRYAREAKKRGDPIVAMMSLDTIGYYSEGSKSQHYPFPFALFYPDKGNFVAFVGNIASRKLLKKTITMFREETSFPSEGLVAPFWLEGVAWSDHFSFWREGYPAILVSDTALFRYPFYHSPGDTPDKIQYAHFARVVRGLTDVVGRWVK